MATGIAALKQQLKELKNQLADNLTVIDDLKDSTEQFQTQLASATNPSDIARLNAELADTNTELEKAITNNTTLSQEAGQVSDRMVQINEQVKIFTAGSPFEVAANAVGDIGSKLLSLDFEGAAESSELLTESLNSITPENIQAQMDGLKTTIVNLAQNGVSALKGMINTVKTVGQSFLQMGKIILSNPMFLFAAIIIAIVAAVVLFLNKIGVLKKIMEAVGAVFDWIGGIIDAVIQAFKDLTDWLGLTNNAAEDAAQKQADAQAKIAASQKLRTEEALIGIDAEIKRAELQGKSTEALERRKVYLIAFTAKQQYLADQAAYKAAVLKGELDEKEIADLKEKARLARLAYKQTSEDTKTFEVQIAADKIKENEKTNDKIAKNNEKTAADAESKSKEAAQKRAEAAKERIAQARLIRDLELDAMEEGAEKEIAINKEKYKRLIEDTKANTKITAEERKRLVALYEKAQATNEKEITEKNEKDKAAVRKQYMDQFAGLAVTEADKAKFELQKAYDEEIEQLKTFLEQKTITQAEYDAEVLAAKQRQIDAEKEMQKVKDEADKQARLEKDVLEAEYEMNKNTTSLESRLAYLEASRRQELGAADLTAAEIALINQRYDMEAQAMEKENQQKKVDMTLAAVAAIGDLLTAAAGDNEKAQKRAFQINKAFALGTAVTNTALAVTAALTAGGNPLKLATGQQFVEAGIAAATGAANIIKIATSKFGGGGGGAAAPAKGGSDGSGGAASTPAAPSLSLFGNGSSGGNSATGQNSAEVKTINVNVGIDEITKKQNNVNQIIQSGTL